MTTTDRILQGARASSLVMCERKAAYEGLGAERDETDPRMERIFRRGRRIGQVIAEEIAENMAAEGRAVEVEREITWAAGTGHADIFVPDDRHTIEVVSTPGAALPSYKPRQVAFYSHHDPDSDFATVLSIDPSTNEERAYPIDVETFVPWIEETVERVVRAIRTGDVGVAKRALDEDGEQVEHPEGFACFNCPFKGPCWAGWEPAPVGMLPDDLHDDVRQLADLEDKLARYKPGALPAFEEQRDVLRGRLRGRMRAGSNYRAPGFTKVRVTEVAGRRSFGLKAFEDAGHVLPEIAEAFVTTGRGHDRWYITREETP